MAILVNKNTKVIVQGITGENGKFHTSQMLAYGTKIVGGVTPGKGGQSVEGVPVFNTVSEAVRKTDANASIIFVPARFAPDAILEAADAGIRLIVVITEGIVPSDMLKIKYSLRGTGVRIIGPNCPGIITADECKVGIMPGYIHKRGKVGVISRSGTLTYEAVYQLTKLGIGETTCVGIGGDPIVGTTFLDLLELFSKDDETECVVMIGEIGGSAEEEAADYIAKYFKKPVVSFIAGATAPPEKRMGHAGAIISGKRSTAQSKMEYLKSKGIKVVENPSQIGDTVWEILKKK
ncbi:MAG: succinate--CoA ligase subunit alpha [Deltaproteobacteria bacterium]|nr:succinate--CoA ligase subunit alpha [Deltaproteobacteria bacterium]